MSRTMKALLGVWIAALAAAAVWIGWDAYQGGKPAVASASRAATSIRWLT